MTATGGHQELGPGVTDVLRHDRGLGLSIVGTNTDPAVVDRWAEIFQAMADTNRLRILLAVHYCPGINVSDLAEAVQMTAKRHLTRSRCIAHPRHHQIGASWTGAPVEYRQRADQIHALLHEVGATHPPPHAES